MAQERLGDTQPDAGAAAGDECFLARQEHVIPPWPGRYPIRTLTGVADAIDGFGGGVHALGEAEEEAPQDVAVGCGIRHRSTIRPPVRLGIEPTVLAPGDR